MKILISFFITLFLITTSYAQEKGITISHKNTSKEKLIKENTRIRLKTIQGKKITGKFKIIDANTIKIRKNEITITDIKKIKQHPLAYSLPVGILLFSGGTAISIGGAIGTGFSGGDPAGFLFGGLLVTTLGVIRVPNLLKGYKKSKGWEYKIIHN